MNVMEIKFEKENLDVVKLLHSHAVVGMYRGREIWYEIENLMNKVKDGTLVLIDLRMAYPLQYVFCQHAFGPLFEASEGRKWAQKYIIFQMQDFHKPAFFRGILKHIEKTELPRKESEAGFVSADMYTKLILGDTNLIDFKGNLKEYEQKILDVVNRERKIAAKGMAQKSRLTEEIVVDGLRSLEEKHFIVVDRDRSGTVPIYCSFYNYF